MMVSDHMTRNPVTIGPDELLSAAQAKMESGGFRQLPVLEGEQLVGIVTDRDVRQHGRQMRITKVSEVMTTNVLTIPPKTPLEEAARLLLKHKIGGLPVVAGDKLLGIITTTDLLQAFIDLVALSATSAARR